MTQDNLQDAVLRDQHLALRETVRLSIPINMVLGACAFAVAIYSGVAKAGAIWLAFSTVVNLSRLWLCRFPLDQNGVMITRLRLGSDITRANLNMHSVLAFCSGLVWAFIPLLSDWYTTAQTLFYAAVVCGITAGAVTYGYSYARVPTFFITPPLVSSAICLWDPGVFDRYLLAATTVLYLFALARGARVNEGLFVNNSRRSNEAKALSTQLELATKEAVKLADDSYKRANLDQLTGLLNRRGFLERAEIEIIKNEDLAMFMLDLDGFKAINDAFGHRFGDKILVEIADKLNAVLGDQTIISRLGGDEFAVLFPSGTSVASIVSIAVELINIVSRRSDDVSPMKVGMSIGIYFGKAPSLDDALQYADVALYAAKQAGRNQYKVFDEILREKVDV